jgi:RNA-directed DNA polymerase
MMNGRGKSDGPVLPTKLPNNTAGAVAEAMEGRGPAKGNVDQQNAPRTQRRDNGAQSALDRVREVAKKDSKMRFTALLHHLTLDSLRQSFFALKRRAAAGVDGVTWKQFEVDLEQNLRSLHERLHRGAYRARPTRRVFIPKPDGRKRPLGIATLEDKIVQRAVVEVLNAIYEEDFLGFSYGFRPGRGQHDALDALAVGIKQKKVNWVLDADIRGFFDAINHEWLVRFVEHRIADRRIVRLIQKWLTAGVLCDGKKTVTNVGSPQGATISPLLANIFLHYVFDLWAEYWRRHYARGEVIIVRYADDFVLGFQHASDAKQFRSDLDLRLGKFGLELHPDKTQLLRFGRFASCNAKLAGEGKAGTFDFLGFTHTCGKTKNGGFKLLRQTSKAHMRVTLKALHEQLMRNRHKPIPEQGVWLWRVLQGYFRYYAVRTNCRRLDVFRTQVIRFWLHALRRRSQRHRMTWSRMNTLVRQWLPPVRLLHPWPEERFFAKTRGKSPVR